MLNKLRTVFFATAFLVLTACASLNPMSAAKTNEQRAYALYGTFVVFEEQAAKLVQSPSVSPSLKQSLRDADARAKPAADGLMAVIDDLIKVQAEVKAGTSSSDRLRIVLSRLDTWYFDTKPKVESLVLAVKGAK